MSKEIRNGLQNHLYLWKDCVTEKKFRSVFFVFDLVITSYNLEYYLDFGEKKLSCSIRVKNQSSFRNRAFKKIS